MMAMHIVLYMIYSVVVQQSMQYVQCLAINNNVRPWYQSTRRVYKCSVRIRLQVNSGIMYRQLLYVAIYVQTLAAWHYFELSAVVV